MKAKRNWCGWWKFFCQNWFFSKIFSWL